MSINEYSALASIIVAVCAIPAAFYYILKIKKLFNFRRKQKSETIISVQTKKLHKIFYPISIGLIHMFAFLGVSYIIFHLTEMTITFPQAGFGGPAPKWASSLIFMPICGFVTSWIFTSLVDTYYYIFPENFKKPFTRKSRYVLSNICFLLGMSMSWLYAYSDTFTSSIFK